MGRTIMQERLSGVGQAVGGGVLVTLKFWGQILDQVVAGAHVIAAIGGAVLAVHGVWRIFWPKRRRVGGLRDVA